MKASTKTGILVAVALVGAAAGKLIVKGGAGVGGAILGRSAVHAVTGWLSSPDPYNQSFRSGLIEGAGSDAANRVLKQVAEYSEADAQRHGRRLVANHLSYSEQIEVVQLRHALAMRLPDDICGPALWDGKPTISTDSMLALFTASESQRLGFLLGLAWGRQASGKPPLVPPSQADGERWGSIIMADESSPEVKAILAAARPDPPPGPQEKCAGARGLLRVVVNLPQDSDDSRYAVYYLLRSAAR